MKPFTYNPHCDLRPASAFQSGDLVRIPKGVPVRTMHPSRNEYVTARAQRVKVDHTLSGRFVSVREALEEYRQRLEGQGFDISELERWRADNAPEYYRCMVQIEAPSVRWAGSGGYWCEVPASAVEKVEKEMSEKDPFNPFDSGDPDTIAEVALTLIPGAPETEQE